MKIAIETTLNHLAVAIETKDGKTDQIKTEEPQAENLLPNIETLLSRNHEKIENLTEIRVTIGPGSFTGIRIGLAGAKALSLGTGIKLLAFETFDLLKASHPNETGILAIDTKRGDFYTKDENGKTAILTEENLKGENILLPNDKTDALTLLSLDESFRKEALPYYMRPPEISCKKR